MTEPIIMQYDTLLVSGFPGIGKSYYCNKTNLKVLDSDSSKFSKSCFPGNYIKHIKDNLGKVDIIFISTHKQVRDALVKNNLEFTLVYPDISLKEEYKQRYKKRGSNNSFLMTLDLFWDEWIKQLENQKNCNKIVLQSNEYLSHVINKLENYKY